MRMIGRMIMAAVAITTTMGTLGVHGGPFKYRSYGQMVAHLKKLNATYPELVRVSVAQDTYKLPYPDELSCFEDDDGKTKVPCQHFVVHLTNHSTLAAQADRPQVFFSGALHGDERIGPITTIEMITLVATLATAYARPESPEAAEWASVAPLHTQRWLHHLVNTRDILLTPMTNAYGYSREQRGELGVDPNRDYNYMRDDNDCMQTMTSRVVNEIWRENMFQLAITFHGGMRAISYEWGSPNHYMPGNSHRSQKSPDDAAQAQLSHTLAVFAGAFRDKELYPTGTMNDVVYGVTGGMEDWGYAASWENQFVKNDDDKPFKPCKPTTFGGYPAEKTVYNEFTHRAFNILVETSNHKHPEEQHLGQFEDLYNTELDYYSAKEGIPTRGHVTQNVRLALMLIDMVQPYVRWVDAPVDLPSRQEVAVNEAHHELFPSAALFVNDTKQLTSMGCGGYSASTAQIVSCNSTSCHIQRDQGKPLKIQLAWEVLGALTVDQTKIQVSSDPSFQSKDILWESATQSGMTRRHFDLGGSTTSSQDNSDTMGTSLFVSCVDVQSNASTTLYLRTVAKVDQNWRKQTETGDDEPAPHVPPQSHYVNARTNPKWQKEWNGHKIHGTRHWYSPVIEVVIAAAPVATTVPPVATTSPVVTPTTTSAASSSSNSTDASSDTETDDETDDEIAVEPDFEMTTTPVTTQPPAPTTSTPPVITSTPPPTTTTPPTTLPAVTQATKNETRTSELKTDLKSSKDSPSLLGYGYLTLGLGGLIIALTLTYLKKRVFRSKRRAYMNINQQHGPRSRRSARNDEDEDEDDL